MSVEAVEKSLGGRLCRVYAQASPRFLLLQPVDEYDLKAMDQEAEGILSQAAAPFVLAALPVADWNRDLSPWPAPAVFGKEDFQGGAQETLEFIRDALLPELRKEYGLDAETKTVLGGYSLSGLFALWAAHTAEGFDGAAAASPSVWYPGFDAYAAQHKMKAQAVYLSLGDREERARNPVMAQVGNKIRALHEAYAANPALKTTLVWNQGNHFRDADKRTAHAFAWVMEQLSRP